MRRPRMTNKVRRGLLTAITLSDSWREADGDETLTEAEVDELDAVDKWTERGGLRAEPERGRRVKP